MSARLGRGVTISMFLLHTAAFLLVVVVHHLAHGPSNDQVVFELKLSIRNGRRVKDPVHFLIQPFQSIVNV